jgi:hypothetical protein
MIKSISILGIKKVATLFELTDLVSRIIKSHLVLELILDAILKELVLTDQKLEIKRLSFALKLDLCYTLVPPMDTEIKPLLLKINKVRNDFAHNHDAKFGESEAVALLNIVPIECRKTLKCFKNITTPIQIWHACFYCSYITLNIAFSQLAEYKASQQVLNKEIDELLKKLKPFLKNIKQNPIHRAKNRHTQMEITSVIQEIYDNHN